MKKKILFYSNYIEMAGTETFMLNVVKASNRNVFQFDFLISDYGINAYTKELEILGCNIYRINSRRESPLKYYMQLNKFFKEHQGEYNAIHWCGGNLSSIASLYYAFKYKVPVRIVHSHSSSCEGLHNKILHSINKLFLPKLCTHFFACSSLAAKFFFGGKESVIIKNGIDVENYRFNEKLRREYRNLLNIDEQEFVIGHVGRFTGIKNQKFIVDILKQLIQTKFKATLMLIGIGELMDVVKEQVKEYNLEDKVLFLGQRSDVDKLMQAMDVFVMPSLFEGLPFVLVEAQTASLPCVISDTINYDVKISPLVIFMSLNADAKTWANKIQETCSFFTRSDKSQYVVDNGFSMSDTIKYLANIYDH